MSTRHILVSDIDGTLLKDGQPTPGLRVVRKLLEAHWEQVILVYATGRSFQSAWDLVQRDILPEPTAIASFVGTELWFPDWSERFAPYTEHVEYLWDRNAVCELVETHFRWKLQEDEFQSPWKVSYYLEGVNKLYDVERLLAIKGLAVRTVYSCGRFLDILPMHAGKANAVKYLQRLWNVPPQSVLTCGDSGNDIDMLMDPDTNNVAVGNLAFELKLLKESGRFYTAELNHAAGVLEGAVEFDFWPTDGRIDCFGLHC